MNERDTITFKVVKGRHNSDHSKWIAYEVVAYRVEGEPGWRLTEIKDGDDVEKDLKRQGVKVAKVRRKVVSGSRRIDEKRKDDRDLGFAYYRLVEYGWAWDQTTDLWIAPEDPIPALSGNAEPVEAVEIRFGKTEYGWQPVYLSVPGQSAMFDASDVYDPFPEVIEWLEAIARGEQSRVVVNQEGSFRYLLAFPTPDSRARIMVSPGFPGFDASGEIAMDIDIDRRVFVDAFYRALHAHTESTNYDPTHWEFDLRKLRSAEIEAFLAEER